MMCRLFLTFMAWTLLLVTASMPAQAASFDCAKARKPAEIAVCKHRDLSELDTQMASLWYAYRRIPMLMGGSGVRMDDAHTFLRRRAACGSSTGCLRRVYRARIRQLKHDLDSEMNAISQEENSP